MSIEYTTPSEKLMKVIEKLNELNLTLYEEYGTHIETLLLADRLTNTSDLIIYTSVSGITVESKKRYDLMKARQLSDLVAETLRKSIND